MRLSKLLPSRYLFPSTPKIPFTKRRRLQAKQEEEESRKQEQQSYQEQQEQEVILVDEPVFYREEECGATLYNLEMVAIGDQSTLVIEQDREVTAEEVGETHEIKREYSTQRQDVEDIRNYGLSAEDRQEPMVEEERDHQENQERDAEEFQLRKMANKNTKKTYEDDDYGPSFIDTLCFSSKDSSDINSEFRRNDITSEPIDLDPYEEAPKPFDKLVGGYLYKNHKDDKIGLCIKN